MKEVDVVGAVIVNAARQVLPDVRRLLAHAMDVQSSARGLGQSVSGDLVLGCYPTLTPFLLPVILRGFPGRHPAVTVRLFEATHKNRSGVLAAVERELKRR